MREISKKETKKIEVLQVLRAYGAFSVFTSHFFGDYNIPIITMGGQLGVAVFFVISGYLLIITTAGDMKYFLAKRMIRLLPLYYMLTVSLIILWSIKPEYLHTSIIDRESVIKAFLFIPNRIKGEGDRLLIQPILPIAWTLYLEVFVYIVYFLVYGMTANHNCTGKIVVVILAILHIITELTGTDNVYLSIYGSKVMLYFMMGMIIALCLPKDNMSKQKRINIVSVGIGLACFLLAEQCYGQISYIKIIFVTGMFLGIITYTRSYIFPTLFVKFGDISYSFYLLHYFAIKFFARILHTEHIENVGIICVLFVTCFLFTTGLSYVSWQLVECRFGNYLRKKLEINNR